jgi:hypothetical protein
MRGRIRPHLTYANLASSLALFIALAGGTAWAVDEWTGANIQDGTLASADYKNNDIRSLDVKTDSLTGADVAKERSRHLHPRVRSLRRALCRRGQ